MSRASALLPVLLLALASTTASARPCATLALREAVRDGSLPLSSLALQTRPPSVGFVDSETLPVRVHWEAESVSARAPLVLSLVEDAWTRLVDDMGFPAPLPDEGEGGDERFDVYLGFVAPAAALTIAGEDVSADDGRAASYAYLHLSSALSDAMMPTFVHHEMAHAVQFALDLDESLMFSEASAVAYERLALPGDDAWADSLEDFQSWPQLPVFTNGIDAFPITGRNTLYEQGAALFLLYLEQEHGDFDGTLIRRLWEASVQERSAADGGSGDRNEPDWLDALPELAGAPARDLVLDFASWRVLLGAWAVPGEGLEGGASLPGTALVRSTRLAPASLDGAPTTPPRSGRPHPLGCAAFEVQALASPIPLVVEVESVAREGEEPRPLGAAWVLGNPSEDRAERARLDDTGPSLAFSLEVPPRDTLVLFLCDVGDADADELPRPTEIVLSLHNESVPRFDAGPPPADAGPPPADAGAPDEDGGIVCLCQHVPAPRSSGGNSGPFAAVRPYAVAAMSVIGLLVLFARGRAVVRRRRLYKDDARRKEKP